MLRRARKLLSLLADSRLRRGLRHGVAAAVEHRGLLAGLRVATVIDVGAHRGQFSLLAAALFPDAEIHALEPLDTAAADYERLFAGRSRVHLHRVAAGPAGGTALLNVSRRTDSSSLLPITPAQTAFAPGTDLASRARVTVCRLDQLLSPAILRRPVLLKLDVQGYELDALRGAEGLLHAIDHIYAEVSFVPLYAGQALAAEVVAHLAARGFVLAAVNAPCVDHAGRCIQSDFLFSRRGEPCVASPG